MHLLNSPSQFTLPTLSPPTINPIPVTHDLYLLSTHPLNSRTQFTPITTIGINCTSAYPVTWMRKEWSPQEERLAREVDGELGYYRTSQISAQWFIFMKYIFIYTSSPSIISQTSIYNTVVYLHEIHAVNEWRERMPKDKMDAVAACHDENVAKAAKAAGFKVNILFFY